MPAVEIFKRSVTRRVPSSDIRRLVSVIAKFESRKPLKHLTVVFLGNGVIRQINNKFLNHDYATDVISFDLGDKDCIEGEIYVGAEVAARQSKAFGVSFSNEVLRLVAHGFLHILGYDDATSAQREAMLRKGDHYINRLRTTR